MLEKLKDRDGKDFVSGVDYFLTASSINKINACIDVVNDLVEQLHRLTDAQIVDGGRILAVQDTVKVHEKEIDKLREHFADASKKINSPETAPDTGLKYNTKWIGKLCKFRDGGYAPWQYGILTDITPGVEYPFWMRDIEFAECQPVSEEEFKDVIYKRE